MTAVQPCTAFVWEKGRVLTLTFSSRMSSAESVTGCSIASSASICRMQPSVSKFVINKILQAAYAPHHSR